MSDELEKTVDELQEKAEKIGKKQKSEEQQKLEELYVALEEAKAKSKEEQMYAKNLKEEIVNIMNELGKDEIIINGLDAMVVLTISYPEREVLDKKALAEALGIPQKELSKPQVIIELTQQGKLTAEMIDNFTVTEERMQFSVQDYNPDEE